MTLGRAQFVVIAVVVTITTLVVTITTVSVRLAALGLPRDLSLESSLPPIAGILLIVGAGGAFSVTPGKSSRPGR